jgi:hypothetical protein
MRVFFGHRHPIRARHGAADWTGAGAPSMKISLPLLSLGDSGG